MLQLEQGKFYVGITSKAPEQRMLEHKNGFMGAKWPKKYKPIKLLYKKDLGVISFKRAQEFENKAVRRYVKKYGLENVRGGDISYSGRYFKRFGHYIIDTEWSAIRAILVLTLVILILLIDKLI